MKKNYFARGAEEITIGGSCTDCGHRGLVLCPGCGRLMCGACSSHNIEQEMNT